MTNNKAKQSRDFREGTAERAWREFSLDTRQVVGQMSVGVSTVAAE